MDFLKNIQDQFQAMIEDVNLQCAENVSKIMDQIEQAKLYVQFITECIDIQDNVTSYALSIQDREHHQAERLKKIQPVISVELQEMKKELKNIKDTVIKLPQDTVQIISDVYQAWIYSMNMMDEFSKKTISKLWESNDELGRMIKSQSEKLQKKDNEINKLSSEVEQLRKLVSETTNSRDNLTEKTNELEMKNENLVQQLRDLNELVSGLTSEKASVVDQAEELKQRYQTLEVTYRQITEEYNQSNLSYESQINQLREQLEEESTKRSKLKVQLNNEQHKHMQWIDDKREKELKRRRTLNEQHDNHREKLQTLLQSVNELKEGQQDIKSALQSFQQKYIKTLINGSNDNTVTLESILSNIIAQIINTRNKREEELKQQIMDMESEYKLTMKLNIELQRKITDALAAYRRVHKQLKKAESQLIQT